MLTRLFNRKRLVVNIIWLLLIAFIVLFKLVVFLFPSVDSVPIGH